MQLNRTTKDKYSLYLNAFIKTSKNYAENPAQDLTPAISKLVVYGVKAVNLKTEDKATTQEEAERNLQFGCLVQDLMSCLKPGEFIQLFPITKDFKGHRWEMKDYFYTRDYVKKLQQDKPIGEKVSDFLWEYTNREIRTFNVYLMKCMDDLRRLEGKSSLAAEWAETNNINTYSKYTDQKGREFLLDKKSCKSLRLKKKKPRYLRVIK